MSVQNARGSGGLAVCATGARLVSRNVMAVDNANAITPTAMPPRRPTAIATAPANGEARIVPKKNAPYTIPSSLPRRWRGVVCARCAESSGKAALPIQ